jgi:hypothetical protein
MLEYCSTANDWCLYVVLDNDDYVIISTIGTGQYKFDRDRLNYWGCVVVRKEMFDLCILFDDGTEYIVSGYSITSNPSLSLTELIPLYCK